MNSNFRQSKSKNPADIWREFIQAEVKTNSNLGKIFAQAGYGGYEEKTLILYFTDEALSKSARGQSEKLKNKLNQQSLLCDRIDFRIGEVPRVSQPTPGKSVTLAGANNPKIGNPLQALNFTGFGQDRKGNESQPVLAAAVKAEASCDPLYNKLKQRTETLAGSDGVTIPVSFNWRLRVGGTRGFRELLLPVFHPIFGIPYIPSASLKGSARAWARNNGDASRVLQLLGMLEGNTATAAKVEFLDAFPTKHCLSVDVATPQWHWANNKVAYKPEPHPLLSMEQPQIFIGLRPTALGTRADVLVVKEWLENALKIGIGSRVSSGYGRALGQVSHLPHSQSSNFELWTQGMYGSEPPSRENQWQGSPEFRPTAVRGILRYWFRAVALGLYDAATCQTLEEELFGKLSQQGQISISVLFNSDIKKVNPYPYLYTGRICLEAAEEKYLNLVSRLLILASHLGGVGRGSRRPLHLLNGRMRGCHWEVIGDDLPFEYDTGKWKQFFQDLRDGFNAVRSPVGSYTGNPGIPRQRQQDVLDKNAQVWLLKSPSQVAPEQVKSWQAEGNQGNVLGAALSLLYGNTNFKGKNQQGLGNSYVGGELETPSFVWIKSIFPPSRLPYQVITIFGVDYPDRLVFAQALQKLGADLVFGQMPSGNQPQRPQVRRR